MSSRPSSVDAVIMIDDDDSIPKDNRQMPPKSPEGQNNSKLNAEKLRQFNQDDDDHDHRKNNNNNNNSSAINAKKEESFDQLNNNNNNNSRVPNSAAHKTAAAQDMLSNHQPAGSNIAENNNNNNSDNNKVNERRKSRTAVGPNLEDSSSLMSEAIVQDIASPTRTKSGSQQHQHHHHHDGDKFPNKSGNSKNQESEDDDDPCCSCCCGPDEKRYKGNFRDIPVCRSGISKAEDYAIVERFCDNSIYTTKYSLKPWTLRFFLWKMLWEQFQRKANIYFLIIGGIQMIPGISPTGQFTTISTLVIVMLFSFLKNGVEDVSRYRRDNEVNSRPAHVLKSFSSPSSPSNASNSASASSAKGWQELTYADIRVGDLVRVDNGTDEKGNRNNAIPCDLILLATSEEDGSCYVETANLDGETNLKMRKASDFTHIPRVINVSSRIQEDENMGMNDDDHEDNGNNNNQDHEHDEVIITYDNINELAVAVQEKYRGMTAICEHPNMNLYKFTGNLTHPEWAAGGLAIDNNHTLYRGCTLRKVQWAIGLAVFTGHESKVMKNANNPPHKASRVERMVNRLMFVVLVLQAILCIVGAVGTGLTTTYRDWYLASNTISSLPLNTFLAFLTFVILTNNFIPISLYVSLEFIKFYQGRLMEQDLCMYYPPKDMPAMAKATDLNEELGQINYVFSDKTGTLTRNVMHFLKFAVSGEIYGLGTTEIGRAAAKRKGLVLEDERPARVAQSNDPFWDPRMVDNRWVSLNNAEEIRQFFMALAICHTVVVDNDQYEAESPDEEALVRAARKFGYTFTHRASDHIIIETKNGSQHRVELLEVIHFTSDRKRMSVVCKLPQGDIVIYTKGAETTMFPRLRDGSDFDTAERIQNSFAEEGLRPLIVASRSLEPTFAKTWLASMKAARSLIGRDVEREELIADLAVEVECDLRLVGITGVEDKLQDQVPETILALRKAGVSVWMLTGDKRETAINIGFACDFLHKEMQIVEVFGYKKEEEKALLAKIKEGAELPTQNEVACIIDGHTLAIVLHNETNMKQFYELVSRCSSVICCRVSPKQKADVVELMKRLAGDSITTLAIGDGANDVPMIQAAHVGVGISGMEGQQAANSADFAIGQFKYLHRLMLVHGRVNYSRLTLVINYFFYKNALLVMTQFWFCLFNRYSGQSLYEQWSLAAWNVVFTSVPVLIVGILDRDILNTDRIHDCPQLYKRGLANEALNFYVFTGWVCVAIYHSAVCFFGVFFGSLPPAGQLAGRNGIDLGLDGEGVTLYTVIIIVATVKLGFHVKSFTAYHWLALIGSIAAWFGFLVVYSSVTVTTSTTLYAVMKNVGFILMPWLFALLMFLLCLFPDIVYKYGLFNFHMWCSEKHQLKAREAVMLVDAEDSIAAVRVPKELLRRRQLTSGKGGAREDGGEDDPTKEKLFKSAAEEATESLHTRQGWLLEFVDQGVEDGYREFTFGELRRYKIGLGISSVVSLLIVANFAITLKNINQVELGGWALLSIACWSGFAIVMFVPAKILRNFIHYIMSVLLLFGFSGMAIANLAGAQRSPQTHPVTDGIILLGLIVLLRPPLVHALMYVIMNTVLYVIWFQVFTVPEWSTTQFLVRILELIIVAVTSLLALAATERFTRKVFISQLQVKRAVKAVTREEERSMLLLQNVFPAAIVQEIREVKRPLTDFSCTFHEASMLNSDIVKFTQFSSTKEPHVVVEMLNRMFTKFDAHAAELGLEKIKTIGDAYLCASGIPVPDEFHHRKIISMGRKMVHSMFEMNKEGLPSLPNLDLHIRVGAATGPIRAGVVGLQKACFDVFGEVSEDSEHMESSGRPDRLQVTEELYEAAKTFFQFEQLENKDGNMGYFVIDDGIEPFMGLRAQIEERKREEEEKKNPSPLQQDLQKEGDINSAGGSRSNSRNISRAGSMRSNNGSAFAADGALSSNDLGASMNIKVKASSSPRLASDATVAEDGSPLDGSMVAQLLGGDIIQADYNNNNNINEHRDFAASFRNNNNNNNIAGNDLAKSGDINNNNNINSNNNSKQLNDAADDDASKILPAPRQHPLTNDEKLEDLYKFLEDTNDERQDLVRAYAGFDGDNSIFDLTFSFERAEEEFKLYYQKLAESRFVLETVQGFLVFAICALLVGLQIGTVNQWFVIAQIVVSSLHVFLVALYVILKKLKKMEDDENKKNAYFNFGNEDPNHTTLGDAGSLPSATSPQKALQNRRSSKIGAGKKEAALTVDDGLTQEDLLETDEDDDEEVDPNSPQFNINHIRNDKNYIEPPICTWIRGVAFASGLLSFSMPILLVALVNYKEIEVVMVFVMLASVVYITSFLHLRFVLKVIVTLVHLGVLTAVFFWRVAVERNIRSTEDGGNYLAVILCYILCIIASYTSESNVRHAFAVAKKVVFQNAELLSAIDLCDKLLKNVLPVSIVHRMIADPSKAIVDEVDEASVLFLYADGVRPHTEAEAEGKETGHMVNEMNEFLFIMDCLCMYHHVEKIKTVPYLVVSGCPEPIARHCNRLAALARDVILFADSYNQKHGTNIRVKAGLHSGKVTAGVLGATKFIYDVFGDTVNFASRLASSSTWGVVQCSDQARSHLDGFTEVIDRGEIELKGKGMQKVYTLDLATVDLKIPAIVTQMTHAGQVDHDGFKNFDPHMKIFSASKEFTANNGSQRDAINGERRDSTVSIERQQNNTNASFGPSVSSVQNRENNNNNNNNNSSISKNPLAGKPTNASIKNNNRRTSQSGKQKTGDAVYDVDLDGDTELAQSPSPASKRK